MSSPRHLTPSQLADYLTFQPHGAPDALQAVGEDYVCINALDQQRVVMQA
jgi:hypothetical protein